MIRHRHLLSRSAALLGLVVVGLTLTACADEPSDTATVVDVVDGDTVDVERDGESVRVRLLNVDAPEVGDDECLGREATDALRELLPVGTVVRLETDAELLDDEERLLAGVVVDDLLVNAEIARQGMGNAIVAEPNEKFYPPVHDAELEAQETGAGLHDPAVACTLLGQIAELEEATEQSVAAAAGIGVGIGIEEVDRRGAALAAAAASSAALLALLDGDRTSGQLSRYDDDVVASLRRRTVEQRERVTAAVATNDGLRASEEQRIEAERLAAEEAARQAAAEAARVAAEEAARQASAAREAEAARQAEASRAASAPAGSGGSGGGSVSYENCDAARAAGAAPLYVGEPGYAGKLDRDKDGVACE